MKLTIMSDIHFRFHGLEVVGEIRLDFAAHSLAGPLPETVELAVDVHGERLLWIEDVVVLKFRVGRIGRLEASTRVLELWGGMDLSCR